VSTVSQFVERIVLKHH